MGKSDDSTKLQPHNLQTKKVCQARINLGLAHFFLAGAQRLELYIRQFSCFRIIFENPLKYKGFGILSR